MQGTFVNGTCDRMGGATVSVRGLTEAKVNAVLTNRQCRWYAVQTRSRYEKTAAICLQNKNIETFLTLTKEVHTWSDRKRAIAIPLFPGYTFVHIVLAE